MRELGGRDTLPGDGAGRAQAARTQVAALCYRTVRDRTEVLMVTSRDTGRWVLPKGWPRAGRGAAGTAAREAYEEAGVMGRIGADPLGSYGYDKRLPDGSTLPCRVTVFPLAVRKLMDDFPERRQRVRRWMSLREAAGRVAEPELAALLSGFSPGAGAGGGAGAPDGGAAPG
jgi:8-oxo-dGTP pyrophosphatase MutT (NUDIX family)